MIYRDGTVRPERFLAVARVRVGCAVDRVLLQRARIVLRLLLEWKTELRVSSVGEQLWSWYGHDTGGIWSLPKRPRHGDRAAVHRATVAFAFLLSLSGLGYDFHLRLVVGSVASCAGLSRSALIVWNA